MTTESTTIAKFILPILAILALSPAANATANTSHLNCDNEFQMINGSWISTPQCENQHLANVANSYGKSVSARQITQSQSMKNEICQFIGHDTRLSNICGTQNGG